MLPLIVLVLSVGVIKVAATAYLGIKFSSVFTLKTSQPGKTINILIEIV